MANALARMKAGGNWETQNVSSLFNFGLTYPEFKMSKAWVSQGFTNLKANLMENFYPDGPCKEATINYDALSVGRFIGAFQTARTRGLGLELPKEHLDLLEKAFDYLMYSTQPDWLMPIWGDTGHGDDETKLLALGAKFYNRPDMQWVASKGKENHQPAQTSVAFRTAGYFIMRSGWDPQARFLVTRNGKSTGHYHADNLSVIVNAYGTDLLPDMGIYSYGTPECAALVRTTSHSTISVDGKDSINGDGSNTWISMPGMDYFDGTHAGFQNPPGVTHRRRICFVKPDYWVIGDVVEGPGDHTVDQFWHAPFNVKLDPKTEVAHCATDAGPSLLITPVGAELPGAELTEGYYADGWLKVRKAPVVKYRQTGSLPKTFRTVLYPLPAGATPSVTAAALGAGVTRISHPSGTDYVAFGEADIKPVKSTSETAMIRTAGKPGKERVTGFSWYKGTSLSFGNELLASSDAPVKGLHVSYLGSTIRITCEEAHPSLRIAALGAKSVIVNGKEAKLGKGAKYITVTGL